ncbi:MAG: hypothetical protein ACREUV_06905, partial [Burkholderiales bacterium]
MNENPQPETQPPTTPQSKARTLNLALMVALLVAALLAWQWYDTRGQIASLQQELGKRLANADGALRDNRAIVKDTQEALR